MLFEDLHINNGDTKVRPSFLVLTADLLFGFVFQTTWWCRLDTFNSKSTATAVDQRYRKAALGSWPKQAAADWMTQDTAPMSPDVTSKAETHFEDY